MNTRHLYTFISVAQCGSFTCAESSLYLSKQAIIKQIDQLEQEIGFSLFDRSPSGVTLTGPGTVFFAGSKQLLELYDVILERSRLADTSKKHIRIEVPNHPRTMLETVLHTFTKHYPDVETETVLYPGGDRLERVRQAVVDVAEIAYSDRIEEFGLCYEHLFRSPYYCVVSKDHPLAQNQLITPHQLDGHRVVVRHMKYRHEIFHLLEKEAPSAKLEEYIGEELEALYNTCYNSGIYITPAYYAQELQNLCSIPLHSPLTRDFGIVYRSNSDASIRRFIHVAKELFSKELR